MLPRANTESDRQNPPLDVGCRARQALALIIPEPQKVRYVELNCARASGPDFEHRIERAVVVPGVLAGQRVGYPLPVDYELVLIPPRC